MIILRNTVHRGKVLWITPLSIDAVITTSYYCTVDIITETPESFTRLSQKPGSIYKEVRDQGLLVYKKRVTLSW